MFLTIIAEWMCKGEIVYENIFVSYVSRWWTPKQSICVWEIAQNFVLVKEYGDVHGLMACNDTTRHATHFLLLFCGGIACRTRQILGHLSLWEMLMANMLVHSLRKTDFKASVACKSVLLFKLTITFCYFVHLQIPAEFTTCSYWHLTNREDFQTDIPIKSPNYKCGCIWLTLSLHSNFSLYRTWTSLR